MVGARRFFGGRFRPGPGLGPREIGAPGATWRPVFRATGPFIAAANSGGIIGLDKIGRVWPNMDPVLHLAKCGPRLGFAYSSPTKGKRMAQRRKITLGPNQPPKEAELVPVNQSQEYWNEYMLQDGSVLRLKTVTTEIWRVLDEYDQDGNPIYFVKSGNILTVIAPDNLRKRD